MKISSIPSIPLMTIVQRALLMIFLVVTFPITSLGVSAIEITQVKSVVVDVDGPLYSEVDNVIRAIESNHPLTIVALVKTDTDAPSIPADKLPYVKLPGGAEFVRMQACDLEGRDARHFNCEKDTMLTPTGSEMRFDVCALGTGETSGDTSDICNSGILYVDGEGPVLSGVPTDRVVTRDDELALRFSVRDITSFEETENVCSGVASVAANDGSADLGELTFDVPGCTSVPGIPGCTCDQSVSGFVVDLSSFIDGEETTVCLSATDNLGNIGEESCFPVARDSRETVINSFSFQNSVGEPITQVSDSTTFYGVAIITVPPLFSITNIGVTFPGGADAAAEFLLTCEAAGLGSAGANGRTEGVYTCTTEGITARNTGSGGEVQANVRVLDSAGDEKRSTFNVPLGLDDSVPVLVGLYSPYRFGEESFLANGDNMITLVLQESGAGFASKNVYVTFTGADVSTRSVDDCHLVGAEWHCTIVIQPRDDTVTVSSITGQDDAGNAIDASILPKSMTLDEQPPSFQGDVELENRGSAGRANTRIFAEGDSVMLTAYFYDDSSVFAGDDAGRYASTGMRADVSGFSDVEGAAELAPESCEFKEDYHPYGAAEGDTEEAFSCSWYISSILAEPVSIGFMMKDLVGNEAAASKDEDFILLFEEDVPTEDVGPSVARRERFDGELVPLGIAEAGEEAVDNWKPLDNLTQRTQINVDLLKIHDLPLLFETALEPRPSMEGKVNLLDLNLDPTSCMGDTEYLFEDSLRLIRPSRDSTTLWFYLKMRQGDPRLGDLGRNYLQLNCSIAILAEVEGTLQEAEQENALITITFAPNVQDLGAKLNKEIEELKKGILVRMEWMDTLNDIIDGITKICNILYMTRELSAALDFMNIPFQGVCRVFGPFCYQADAGMRQTVHTVDGITTQLFEYAYYICEFTACRISLFSDDLDVDGKYNAQQAAGSLATSWLEDDVGEEAVQAGYRPTEYHTPALADDGVNYQQLIGSPYPYANPRDSLVWSTLTLCIPGILHNLQKLRNIECKFIKCLEENVEAGVPVSVCRLERTYATCMFVWGEIFHLIPFADWAKGFLRTVTDAINNVFGLLGILFGVLCSMFGTETSSNEVSIIASSCRLVRFVNVVNDFANMGKDIASAVGEEGASFVPGNDACEGVIADEDEEGTEGTPPAGGEGA